MLKLNASQSNLWLFFFILTPSAFAFPHSSNQQVLLPIHEENSNRNTKNLETLRDLEYRDLTAVTTIIVDAFLPSALYNYLIPNPKAHRQDIWTCYHHQLQAQWPFNRDKFPVKVIAVSSSNHNKPTSTVTHRQDDENDKAVAFALWHILPGADEEEPIASSVYPNLLSLFTTAPSSLCPDFFPPGTNLTRAASYEARMTAIEHEFFSPSAYRSGQLMLNMLATHPDWDGNGFAARHVRWGMELAQGDDIESGLGKSLGLPVTLLSSPAGFHVYEGEGFRSVENVTIERLDREEGLWFEVMDWEPKTEKVDATRLA